ncbi:MAG: class I SAM-dependent DNA methyltransferase, partial [Desulfovibrionaceae bacterium]
MSSRPAGADDEVRGRLLQGEPLQALAFLRGRTRSYDVVAAGDVLAYMGELDEVFAAVRRSLVPGGVFAFTVEKSGEQPVRLGVSGRFAHSPAYVESTARASGFAVVKIEDACVRFEEQEPVAGLLCLLQSE